MFLLSRYLSTSISLGLRFALLLFFVHIPPPPPPPPPFSVCPFIPNLLSLSPSVYLSSLPVCPSLSLSLSPPPFNLLLPTPLPPHKETPWHFQSCDQPGIFTRAVNERQTLAMYSAPDNEGGKTRRILRLTTGDQATNSTADTKRSFANLRD